MKEHKKLIHWTIEKQKTSVYPKTLLIDVYIYFSKGLITKTYKELQKIGKGSRVKKKKKKKKAKHGSDTSL